MLSFLLPILIAVPVLLAAGVLTVILLGSSIAGLFSTQSDVAPNTAVISSQLGAKPTISTSQPFVFSSVIDPTGSLSAKDANPTVTLSGIVSFSTVPRAASTSILLPYETPDRDESIEDRKDNVGDQEKADDGDGIASKDQNKLPLLPKKDDGNDEDEEETSSSSEQTQPIAIPSQNVEGVEGDKKDSPASLPDEVPADIISSAAPNTGKEGEDDGKEDEEEEDDEEEETSGGDEDDDDYDEEEDEEEDEGDNGTTSESIDVPANLPKDGKLSLAQQRKESRHEGTVHLDL